MWDLIYQPSGAVNLPQMQHLLTYAFLGRVIYAKRVHISISRFRSLINSYDQVCSRDLVLKTIRFDAASYRSQTKPHQTPNEHFYSPPQDLKTPSLDTSLSYHKPTAADRLVVCGNWLKYRQFGLTICVIRCTCLGSSVSSNLDRHRQFRDQQHWKVISSLKWLTGV